MNPERTASFKEMLAPAQELGLQFLEKWFVPEVLTNETLNPDFLLYAGTALKVLGENFPKSDPDWALPSLEDRLSVFNLYDLQHFTKLPRIFKNFWQKIHQTLNNDALYIPRGIIVPIREFDFLVTTPVDKTTDHAKEAEDSIKLFKKTGKVDFYFRNCWPYPKNLRIGSKFFYVDNRAIRGFAVVTDVVDSERLGNTRMQVDTWRWIKPIPCDYGKIKPPQRYAQAIRHEYFKGIKNVQVIGEWLDPMPNL